jgi:S1-C subfamily serine protease
VKAGDVITAIDGESITEKNSLAKIILKYEVGDKVVLTIVRSGKTTTLSATLGASPTD